jgi:cobalt-zinc-cadmium efflux system protein
MPEGSPQDVFLQRISRELHETFGIAHPTIQIERGDAESGCHQAGDDAI